MHAGGLESRQHRSGDDLSEYRLLELGGRPTGLFGLTSAIALVFSVKSDSQSSTLGGKPVEADVTKGTASTPNISSAILPRIGEGLSIRTAEERVLVTEIPGGRRTIVNGYCVNRGI